MAAEHPQANTGTQTHCNARQAESQNDESSPSATSASQRLDERTDGDASIQQPNSRPPSLVELPPPPQSPQPPPPLDFHPDFSSNCLRTHPSDTGGYAEHLRVCASCRRHSIESYREEINKLLTEPSVEVGEPEFGLTKLSPTQYRQWERGESMDPHILNGLWFTTDGADHGIRREHNDDLRPSSETGVDHTEALESETEEIPFRLIFKCMNLEVLLEQITEDELPLDRQVHMRPFKFLLAHEYRIRSSLEALRTVLRETEQADVNATIPRAFSRLDPTSTMSPTPVPSLDRADAAPPELERKVMGIGVTPRNVRLLEMVVTFMDVEMRDILTIRKKIRDTTLSDITFEYLLHLYEPGNLVLAGSTQQAEARRAYRVLLVTGGRPYFEAKPYPKFPGQSFPDNVSGMPRTFPEDSVSQGLQGKATKMTPVILGCYSMDFDGSLYGPRPHRFIIPEFHGRRKITDLDVYPADFEPNVKGIRQSLRKRGEYFVKCAQGMHREYHGRTLPDRPPFQVRPSAGYRYQMEDRAPKPEALQVDCECKIDQGSGIDYFMATGGDEGNEVLGENKLGFNTGVITMPTVSIQMEFPDMDPRSDLATSIYDDSKFDLSRRSKFLRQTTLLTISKELNELQMELLPLRLFGYALQQRKWYAFNVIHLVDVKALQDSEMNSAFQDLILPEEHKTTIKALVRHQVRGYLEAYESYGAAGRQRSHAFDLIHNKGRGLVILLHGAPGVGKTSTAESVAIQLKRPLLPITCGDLGTEASKVETTLEYFLGLGTKWGCVVLLDEADVFLARRVTGDLMRNSLVSGRQNPIAVLCMLTEAYFDVVFLRQMEYHSGVLILTTNRVGEFDEAFVSRIHMKLHFRDLTRDSSRAIWDMNMRRLEENEDIDIEIRSKGIRKFAEEYWTKTENHRARRWNGRQIKNAFQTAVALAWWDYEEACRGEGKHPDRPVLKKRHFEAVGETSHDFDEYMDRIYGPPTPDGRRSKGAFINEAQRNRLRFHDEEPECVDRGYSQPARPVSDVQHTMRGRPQESAKDDRIAELERQLGKHSLFRFQCYG
ncbi:hypothetical protein LTR36_002469 [Oleoguttula mirabilis]|uniref:AAA+ ATPase domain-containing protein n=1 Tax=Oleoguttula mirabilis TaxID=1507867 RepID=A0AAV9JKX3_9PEZI|nr:hypothetical protein LTR36_002469 [Oleoguttula mirabilis]